jgi:hypothetical protein
MRTAQTEMEMCQTATFLGSGYLQCKADRRAQSDIIINSFDNNTPTTIIGKQHFIGDFDSPHNTNTNTTFLATRHNTHLNTKQNISLSFDPKTMTCTTCNTNHSIMNTYRNTTTHPLTIMLADQNMNATLSGVDGNSLCALGDHSVIG